MLERIPIEGDALRRAFAPDRGKLGVDVVVLAIPNSLKLAEVFVSLGVPHIIAFNFDESSDKIKFMRDVKQVPLIFNMIYSFSQKFYLSLIDECTVEEAYKIGLREYERVYKQLKGDISYSHGPVMYPQ